MADFERMVPANPAAVDKDHGSKHEVDTNDAFFRAELRRLKILLTGYIDDVHWRPVRDWLRRRRLLVQHRTPLMISCKSLYKRTTGQALSELKAFDPPAAHPKKCSCPSLAPIKMLMGPTFMLALARAKCPLGALGHEYQTNFPLLWQLILAKFDLNCAIYYHKEAVFYKMQGSLRSNGISVDPGNPLHAADTRAFRKAADYRRLLFNVENVCHNLILDKLCHRKYIKFILVVAQNEKNFKNGSAKAPQRRSERHYHTSKDFAG